MRYSSIFKTIFFILIGLAPILPYPVHASSLPSPDQTAQKINRVAAVVNKTIITSQELNLAIHITKQQIQHAKMQTPSDDVIRKNVLQQLIYQQLQLDIANQYHISATSEEVTNAMNQIATRQKINISTLKKQAQQDGLSSAGFTTKIKNEIIINKLQQQILSPNINITAQDLNKAQQQLAKQSSHLQQYHVVDILIPLSSSASSKAKKTAHTKAQSIIKQLQSGTNASTLNGVAVNDLGWSNITTLPDLFTQQLSKLPIKGVAGPLDASNGVHIIQLLGKKGGGKISDEEAHNLAFQTQFNQALAKWLKELRSNAYVKIE